MPSKIRQRDLPPKDFQNSSWLPGTAGNPLDVILTSGKLISQIPGFPFFILLTFLASLSAWINPVKAVCLLGFMLLDWLLIGLLPVTHRSFGPVKPVVLLLAVLRSIFGLLPFFWPSIILQLIGTLLVLIGFYFEPHQLDVHQEIFETDKLKRGTFLKVVHLGDLHIERLTKREINILKALEEQKPDLILFSGDILNLSYVYDETAQKEATQFLAQLKAPLGVFAVTGSPPVDPPEVFSKTISFTNLQWLDNRKMDIPISGGMISIAGVTCTHLPERDFVTLNTFFCSDTNNLNVLLYHSPDIAPLACQASFDLQFSGHTHGGQVRIPLFGAIYAASLYGKKLESGRYKLKGMNLYVTRGLGMEGGIAPRVRLFCRPEMIVWQFIGTK